MAVWEECKAKDKQVKQLESRLSEVQQDCCNLTTQLQVGWLPKRKLKPLQKLSALTARGRTSQITRAGTSSD